MRRTESGDARLPTVTDDLPVNQRLCTVLSAVLVLVLVLVSTAPALPPCHPAINRTAPPAVNALTPLHRPTDGEIPSLPTCPPTTNLPANERATLPHSLGVRSPHDH